jgi:hypothetical protein
VNLCTNLVAVATPGTSSLTTHDTHQVSYSQLAKPAKGVRVADPDFGTTMIRISDVQGDWSGTDAVPVYPTVAAWNADESYMLLYTRPTGNYALLDGHSYAFIKWVSINPADIEQFDWDPSNPDLIWFINGKVLTRYHVSTGASDTIYTFPNAADWGDDPIYFSWDGSLFGLRYASQGQAFSYSLKTGISPTVSLSGNENSPEACPSAGCLFWARNSGGFVYNTNMTQLRALTMQNSLEHGDLGLDAQGNDFWAAVSFNEGPNNSSGALMVEWLKSGTIKTVIGDATGDPYPPDNTLISAKSLNNHGWVALAMTGDASTVHASTTYQDQEIMLANVNTGQVCRAAHHRSLGEAGPIGYWSQPNVTISPSGTRIAFPSDWGGGPGGKATASSPVDTYVLELPGYSH